MDACLLWTCMGRSNWHSLLAYTFYPNAHSIENTFFLMFGWDSYKPLVQLPNPKLIEMGDDKSLFALDVLQDIYALLIHNIELSRERQENQFDICCTLIHCWRQSIRKHTGHVWDPKYDIAYHVVCIMWQQLELGDDSDKTQKVNVQDVKISTWIDKGSTWWRNLWMWPSVMCIQI